MNGDRPWLTFDIETYSEADLTQVGAYAYAEHPSSEVTIISWKYCGAATRHWQFWPGGDDLEEFANYLRDPEVLLVAHNAQFERVCLGGHMGADLGLPHIGIQTGRWRCSAALAMVNGLPSGLKNVGAVLDLPLQKDKRGEELIKLLCMPAKTGKAKGTRKHYPGETAEWNEFVAYCRRDTDVEELVWTHKAMRHPDETWWRDYALHEEINDRGIQIDTPLVREMLRFITEAKRPVVEECKAICGFGPGQVAALTGWLEERCCPVDELDKDGVGTLLRHELTDEVRRVLELRLDYAKSSVGKYSAMVKRTSGDERLRGSQRYNGALTGRPTGEGVQVYNFPRKVAKDPVAVRDDLMRGTLQPDMRVASSMLRPSLIAPPGHTFMIADYSAIEARAVGWLADDQVYQREFNGAGKLYEAMAAAVYGCEPSAVKSGSPERFLGKTIILGCGYQMGVEKFINTASEQARDQGVEAFPEATLRHAHATYRDRHAAVVSLWKAMQAAAFAAIRNAGAVVSSVADGLVRFGMRGDALIMRLPSGRQLVYRNARIVWKHAPWDMEKPVEERKMIEQIQYRSWRNTPTPGWRDTYTYGGKLTENAVQALTNDILRGALRQCATSAALKQVVLHVYDEIVVEVAEQDADNALLDYFIDTICGLPAWATDLPLKAEGKFSPFYTK
jgi:DNA polymerase bacteriophage-type